MRSYFVRDNDDVRPLQPTSADIVLRQRLESSISKLFYERSDRRIQNLLSSCRWYVRTHATALTLVIECPDQATNWRVLQQIVPMASLLNSIITSAKIRVCPPNNQGFPFEMRVDELSVYQERA
ncbi:hypothetical protein G7B40_038665 [Aetokthonos hydrillicola Thurmond2011]|jgi:hypothetical protein|uniref:Uncharacterized protein n=1 Tax=Aetokthonos hydrillicola Thurmond2011 TaxID=2712845 RepID=A0AAP5IEW2_9CYAN|nr:hypothetical protein [Aetokthonos hydrillicola]MBO3461359.1 hypothetical protein [Aetokthonos hydrillicola CCALA 1050]MBW4589244.1 hypothetical protein [Aetokthonos hydrillicola CCALA 1050]MDR9900428.1 hypothetical protein [Aetokthonos hydrillicola Thurmond2011]